MTTNNPNNNEHESERVLSRFRPFPYKKDAINAAEQYLSLKTSIAEKRKILERLLVSDDFFKDVCPIIFESVQRLDSHTIHLILDNITRLIIKGENFSPITGNIAKLMIDKNFNIREKATNLLTHMGEDANPATPRLISYLRNKLPDIQLSAAKVLSSIGPKCANTALPKLKLFSNSTNNKRLREACFKAIQILKGEVKPIRPEIYIEGVVATSSSEYTENDMYSENQTDTTKHPANKYPAIRGKSIVIAEDQESVRAMIRKAVTACGATSKETHDGAMVLKMLQAKIDIDLFILDLMMPSISGAEVLQAIRDNPVYSMTPVIIVSARTERSIKLRMAQLEVTAYFSKPFKLTDLLTRINDIFKQ